jgi:hypothetical protein
MLGVRPVGLLARVRESVCAAPELRQGDAATSPAAEVCFRNWRRVAIMKLHD